MKKSPARDDKLCSSPHAGEPNRPERFGGGYSVRNIAYAKGMRKSLTPWELQLWQRLKQKQLGGFKFRRQQPIGPYIVDFLNSEKKLVVELDGSQHVDLAADKMRDAYLARTGYYVLRFWNNEVNENIEGVLVKILEMLDNPPHRNTEEVFRLPLKGGANVHVAPAALMKNASGDVA